MSMWLNNTIQEHDTGAAAKPNKRWRHLANVNRFEHMRHVNMLLGLYVPILTTPVALLNWEGASDDARPSH